MLLVIGSFIYFANEGGAPVGNEYVPAHVDERQVRAGPDPLMAPRRIDATVAARGRRADDCSAVLDRDGEEARVVGGAVRNALLDVPVVEIDVATTAEPSEVMRRAAGGRLQGRADRDRARHRHGRHRQARRSRSPRCARTSRPMAVTPRSRSAVTGRPTPSGAISRSTRFRRRTTARCTTMSAGLPILKRGACASSATPRQRIAEDYLRILRFFRFHAAYGEGPLDKDGLPPASSARNDLDAIVARAGAHGNDEAAGGAQRVRRAASHGGLRPARPCCWPAFRTL